MQGSQGFPEAGAIPAPVGLLNCARLRAWVAEAKPGARLVYSKGSHVLGGCSLEIRDLVQALVARGWVIANFARPPGSESGVYLVTRAARAFHPGCAL